MKREYCFFMFFLVACLIISSCTPNESVIATAIAETSAVEELEEAATQLAEIEQAQTEIPAESASQTDTESSSETKTTSEGDALEIAQGQELAAELCPEGQEMLYFEDFEDENAWGWYNVEDTEYSYENIEGRGKVLSMLNSKEYAEIFYLDEFHNAVWFIDVRAGDPPLNFSLGWHYYRDMESENNTKSFYYTNFASGGYLQIHIVAPDLHEAQSGLVESAEPLPSREPGDWQTYAFSYYDGQVDLWLDGEFIAGELHTNPIEYGGFAIVLHQSPESISVDNIVVCSLSEPYTP